MNKQVCVLIDDDEDDQMIFEAVIKKFFPTYEFHVFFQLADAIPLLEKAQQTKLVAFIDLNMPRVNGKECLKLLRNNPNTQKLDVVILSTSNNPKDVNDCLLLGANAFITKPSAIDEIVHEIAPYLPN